MPIGRNFPVYLIAVATRLRNNQHKMQGRVMEIAIFFFFWFVFAIVVGVAANARGRDGGGWFFLALIISPLVALLLVLVMSSELREGRVRKCPYCAEFIKPEAIVCKHCGRDLPKFTSLPDPAASVSLLAYEPTFWNIMWANYTVMASKGTPDVRSSRPGRQRPRQQAPWTRCSA